MLLISDVLYRKLDSTLTASCSITVIVKLIPIKACATELYKDSESLSPYRNRVFIHGSPA
jgi:hypothetical protein